MSGKIFENKTKENMNRLSKWEYGCYIASVAAMRSEDPIRQVGACLTNLDSGKVIATSYNGLKSGQTWPEEWNKKENGEDRRKKIIHAEQNLFNHSSFDKGPYILYMNYSPCESCSKLIVGQNVEAVIYIEEYEEHGKRKEFKDIFSFYGISYRSLESLEIKNIINWSKKALTKLENLV